MYYAQPLQPPKQQILLQQLILQLLWPQPLQQLLQQQLQQQFQQQLLWQIQQIAQILNMASVKNFMVCVFYILYNFI